ncbi:MAG: sugar transferase [Lachnospiraceae bacterium]|nr:sugar transferase [Lachnospiraceae bacterium]
MEGMFVDERQLQNAPTFRHVFTPRQYAYFPVKRAIDIVLSLAGLIVLAPVFVIIAIVIKLDSPGPVFHIVKMRTGKNGKPLSYLKFRSMIKDAEKMQDSLMPFTEMDGPVFKIANDPRVTKVGRFIRKTSIDELPQLFSVLIGKMSLVGPRPLSFQEIDGCTDWQRAKRLLVTPGLTCIWQVSGRSSISSFEQRIGMDLDYVERIGFLTDMMLLLKTVPVVLSGRGAC